MRSMLSKMFKKRDTDNRRDNSRSSPGEGRPRVVDYVNRPPGNGSQPSARLQQLRREGRRGIQGSEGFISRGEPSRFNDSPDTRRRTFQQRDTGISSSGVSNASKDININRAYEV